MKRKFTKEDIDNGNIPYRIITEDGYTFVYENGVYTDGDIEFNCEGILALLNTFNWKMV